MARVDKTNSAIGVVRAVLAADIASANFDKIIGVGLDATGKVVVGAGQSGIVGAIVTDATASKAGDPIDIFVLADVVEVTSPTLVAGQKVYADNTTGVVSNSATSATQLGFTVSATRVLIRR